MTGGLAFEALNNAGNIDTNMIVVLNDNGMSISPNTGGLSKYLGQTQKLAQIHIDESADKEKCIEGTAHRRRHGGRHAACQRFDKKCSDRRSVV